MSEHKNIYAALCAAQANMGKVSKGSVNPAFKSRYADLADVVSVVVPSLSDQGIAMYHSMVRDDHGLVMRTTLSHGATETHINCDVPLIVDKNNMQGMKSATTYAKRIGLESLTGIAPDTDDDGNAASKAPPRQEPRQEPKPDAVQQAIEYLSAADSLPDLKARWSNIPSAIASALPVITAKDAAKARLQNADLGGDELPY